MCSCPSQCIVGLLKQIEYFDFVYRRKASTASKRSGSIKENDGAADLPKVEFLSF